MADRILAAVRNKQNPTVVVNTMRKPVVKFGKASRGRLSVDGVILAFADVVELPLPDGAQQVCIEELELDSPLVFIEDAA